MLELLPKSTDLTTNEHDRLSQLENTIEHGLQTFVDVGTALLEIRDSHLYRTDHTTFEDYCRQRWGMSRIHAFRLIEAAHVTENLLPIGNKLPATESQARPLTRLEPEQQREAWQIVVDTAPGGKVTAAHVQAVVTEMTERAILEASKQIRSEKAEARRAERSERLAEIAENTKSLAELPHRFPIVYADPPWQYEYAETENRAIENQYPTMSLDSICALPVADVTTDDAVLFMWATSPKLQDAIRVIGAWGFRYRTCAVWVKDKIGMGYYFRQQHELLLVATKGSPPAPAPTDRPASVIEAPRTEHSSKPAEVYDLIARMYPTLPKVEMFARSTERKDFVAWGNQAI